MKKTPYELLKHNEKKELGKNEEAKMTIYNSLPRKEYKRVFMCKTAKEVWHTLIITHQGNSQVKNCKIDLLTQEYEKFSISNEETIDSAFTRFNAIVTSLKSLDLNILTRIILPLDELIGNLKVYDMVLENDGVVSKTTTKENVKSLALKAKVTREQTSEDSDSQDGSNEDVDEEEAKSFNLFGKGRGNSFGNKGGESSKQKGAYYNCRIEGYFASRHANFESWYMGFDKPQKYVLTIICEAGLLGAKPTKIPIEQNHRLGLAKGCLFEDPEQYRRLFMQNLQIEHWEAAVRVVRFLKGSPRQ
ncbi:hypothetical protein Tco_0709109, partial [Tanacetum coccineum]